MSSTPAPTLQCPRCRASLIQPTRFCPSCGVDVARASLAGPLVGPPAESPPGDAPSASRSIDRRLTDSNQAWLGKIVDGRYRVLDVIGRGGVGVVYRVEHMRMGKVAAMKVLHRDLVDDAEVQQRFEREAAAVSKLHHPHTVQVFDFGMANGALYLIMEYVRGQDLSRVLERDGALPWARAAPLLVQICGALQEAHEMGVIHRDLKPENVLITRTTAGRDYAKVLDFGLAKLDQREPRDKLAATDRQQIVGTPYFMAPEQIRGDDVDARTDIYAFGALMFELLTNTHLYTGSTAVGVLTKHLTADPDAPSMRAPKLGIPPQVDHLCRKALARDPSQRWKSAAELAEAIEEVYVETVGDITGPGSSRSNPRPLARRALIADDDVPASELALRRADLDAFERGIRRWRYSLWAATFAVVAAGAGAIAYVVTREPPPLTEEREPNDDVAHANRIAAGVPVTGYLGKRISPTQPDRDVFVVPAPASSRRVVTVSVTAIPNIDIALQLADGDGQHGANADENGVGEPETLHRRLVDGSLVVTVSESMHDKLPVENVSDPYTLTVTVEDPSAGEVEPDDIPADATPLPDGKQLTGYLDTRDDVDMLRWDGEDGEVSIVVRADGVPLEWRAPDGKRRTAGQATVALKKGDLIVLDRTDAHGTGAVVGRDLPWTIVATHAR